MSKITEINIYDKEGIAIATLDNKATMPMLYTSAIRLFNALVEVNMRNLAAGVAPVRKLNVNNQTILINRFHKKQERKA